MSIIIFVFVLVAFFLSNLWPTDCVECPSNKSSIKMSVTRNLFIDLPLALLFSEIIQRSVNNSAGAVASSVVSCVCLQDPSHKCISCPKLAWCWPVCLLVLIGDLAVYQCLSSVAVWLLTQELISPLCEKSVGSEACCDVRHFLTSSCLMLYRVSPLVPSLMQQPCRNLTYYSVKKGKRKTVKAVVQRFLRLHCGLWVRRKVRPRRNRFSVQIYIHWISTKHFKGFLKDLAVRFVSFRRVLVLLALSWNKTPLWSVSCNHTKFNTRLSNVLKHSLYSEHKFTFILQPRPWFEQPLSLTRCRFVFQAGYKKKLWKKSAARKKRLREHVFCNKTQCKKLDKMTTSFWKRRNWYLNDPYQKYHDRVNL